MDQETDILFARETPNLSMHHLPEHINQDIKSRKSKDKYSTVHKTEYWSKGYPTGKPQWVGQTAKSSGPQHLINR